MIDVRDFVRKVSPSEGYMDNLEVHEVALTPSPANRRKFLLTKTHNGDSKMDELIRAVAAVEARNENDLVAKLREGGVSDKGIEVAKTVARMFEAYSDELDAGAFGVLAKSFGVELESADDVDEGVNLDTVPEKVREYVDSMSAQLKALEGQVSTMSEALSKTAVERQKDDIRKKVSGLTSLGKSADEITNDVHEVAQSAGSDAANRIIELLVAANEVAAAGGEDDVLKSHGSGGDSGPAVSHDEAYEKLEQAAQEIRKSSDEKMTLGAALEAAMKKNPELAAAYARSVS